MKQYPALKRLLALVITVVVLGVVVAVAAFQGGEKQPPARQGDKAAAWPMFGGHLSRNMVNTVDRNVVLEWEIAQKGKKAKNILWTADLGSKSYSGPVIGDGKIFIGTNNEKPRDPKDIDPKTKKPIDKGVLMCFEEKTGKFLWQHAHDKLPIGLVCDWPKEGICSTPILEGKKLFYVSNRCEVICSDTDGKIQWKLDMIGQLGVFPHNLSTCSPMIVGDTIFVVTSNGVDEGHINVPAPEAPSFLAIDKHKGKVLWQKNDPSAALVGAGQAAKAPVAIKKLVNAGLLLMHGQWSNPVFAMANGKPQVIFPGGDGWLRAFDPKTGELIWKFDCNPKDSIYALSGKGTRSDFISTPVVHDNKVYIGVGQDPEHDEGIGHFWCIDITKKGDVSVGTVKDKDGRLLEVFDPKDPINKNSALVWHYGEDPLKRKPVPKEWKKGRNYVFGRTMSTAAIHDGLVYIAELAGYLHCLDARTGEQYWTENLKTPIWSSPYWVDGKVYLGTDDKSLYVFQHGKQKKVLAENEMDGRIRATPVVANGVLYVMTENKLYAIASK